MPRAAPTFVPPGGTASPVYVPATGVGQPPLNPDGTKIKCENCHKLGTSRFRGRPDDGYSILVCECGHAFYSLESLAWQENVLYPWQRAYEAATATYRIHNYTHKPAPRFYGRTDNALYFGIENELEVLPDGNIDQAAYEVTQATKGSGLLYYKNDSSLKHGFEIVSHPMSFTYSQKSLPDELGEVFQQRFQNWWTGERGSRLEQCGLHVHMSRAAFGPASRLAVGPRYVDEYTGQLVREGTARRAPYHLYKFARFIYDNPKLVQHVAGRPGPVINGNETCSYDMSKLGLRKTFDHRTKQIIASSHLQLREIARGKVLVGHDRRYMALNFDPPETVELRVFKATTNLRRIKAAVQFCDAAFYYTKYNKLHCRYDANKVITAEGFAKYVDAHQPRYADLLGVLNNDPALAA